MCEQERFEVLVERGIGDEFTFITVFAENNLVRSTLAVPPDLDVWKVLYDAFEQHALSPF